MQTKDLDRLMDWMRTTDLVEIGYRGAARSFELRLEGASPAAESPFPGSRLVPVCSPAVGILRFSAPGKPRKAEAGVAVSAGEILGVIDTGGRPAEVRAAAGGLLAKVLVEDGKPVEYGQPLFLVSP